MGLKYNELTGEFEEEKEPIGYGELVFNPITGEFESKSGDNKLEALKKFVQPYIKFGEFLLGETDINRLNINGNSITEYDDRRNIIYMGRSIWANTSDNILAWQHIIINSNEVFSILNINKKISFNDWIRYFEKYSSVEVEKFAIQNGQNNVNYLHGKLVLSSLNEYNLSFNVEFFERSITDYASRNQLIGISSISIFTRLDKNKPYIHWFKNNIQRETEITNLEDCSQNTFEISTDGSTIIKLLVEPGNDGIITIPEGIEAIGNSAFFENIKIKEVILPYSLKRIGSAAFWGCKNLRSIKLPTHLTEIEDDAFLCAGLEDIVIPGSVIKIGNSAFRCPVKVRTTNRIYNSYEGALYSKDYKTLYMYPVKSEVSVTLHEKTEVISSDSFVNCTFIHLVIPKNVKKFSKSCFKNCTSLKNLTLLSENLYGIDFEYNPLSKIKQYSKVHCLYVLGSQLKAAKVSSEFTKFEKILPIPGTEVLDIISTSRIKSMMFPIDGLSIFKDTYRSELGYEKVLDKYIRTPEGHKFILRDGLIAGVAISRPSSIPGAWTRLGLDWKLSFNYSVECLKKIGFNVISQRWNIKTNEHYNRQYLVGEIKAETLEKDLNVTLKFDWDDEHPYSAPSTIDGSNGLTEISIIYK